MNHFNKSILSILLILIAFISVNAQHSLYIDTVKDGVKVGTNVSVSLRTKGFNGIVGIQGSINWDASTLVYKGISFGTDNTIKLTASDVNITQNYLTFLWTDAALNPNTVVDTSILLTLNFIVKKDVIGNNTISLSNTPIPVQIVDSLIATPISLKSFTGYYDAGWVNLNWVATIEGNVSKYIIQRSNNGINFENIKPIISPNTKKEFSYSFKDQISSPNQNLYYRLLVLETNGTYSFSKIIAIKIMEEKSYSLFSYPNPVYKTMTVKINAFKSQKVSFKIVSSLGKQVHKESIQLNTGFNFISLEVGKYAPGNYFMVVDGDYTSTQQFIKLSSD